MRVVNLAWLLFFGLLLGCSAPEAAPCPDGRVLKDGFCAPLVCDAGNRVVDGQCVPLECPPGASPDGDDCRASDTTKPATTATPGGGTYAGAVEVVILANEPAIVFYSLDGTTPTRASESGPSPLTVTVDATADLRFFAVDAADNEEGVNSESYVIDASGPENITDLAAVVGPPDVDLTWTNPGGVAGILLVRGRAEPFGWQPENGKAYNVSEVVAPGVVVLANTEIEALNDPTPWGDISTYAVWAYDDVFNYSAAPSTAQIELPVPLQPLTLDIDLSTGTIDFAQPPDMRVSLTPEITTNLDELSIDITVENLTPSPMYSIKAIVRSISTGTVSGEQSYDGDPAFYFGANAVPSAATRTKNLLITAIPGGTSSITVELDLATHPVVFTQTKANPQMYASDTGYANFRTDLKGWFFGYPGGSSFNNPQSGVTSMALSPDGLGLYVGANNMPRVKMFDLVTMEEVLSSASLGGLGTPPIASTKIAMSPDQQFIYVTMNEGIHGGKSFQRNSTCSRRPTGSCEATVNVVLVKLNAADLSEVGRVTLESGVDNTAAPSGSGMPPSVSPDGTRVAVAIDYAGRVHYVDADAMSVLWSKDTSAISMRPRFTAIDDANTFVYLISRNAEITRINTANQLQTNVPGTGFNTQADGGNLTWGPDGLLYATRYITDTTTAPLARIDVSDLGVEVDTANNGRDFAGCAFQRELVFCGDDGELLRVYGATNLNELFTRPLGNNIKGHHFVMTPKPLWFPN